MKELNKKNLKKTIFQVALTLCLIMLISAFLFLGAQIAFNTDTPFIAVPSRSMTISNEGADKVIDPFGQTLQKGDLLIIQGIPPQELKTDYPNSDIIAYHNPANPNEKIIHRILTKTEINGTIYFFTKGDGNTQYKWPNPVDPAYFDQWFNSSDNAPQGAISQELVEGKVIIRIPWIGGVALFLGDTVGDFADESIITVIFLATIMLPILLLINLFYDARKRFFVEQ